MADTVEEKIEIKAKPSAVYDALTVSEKFSDFTGGAPAEIGTKEGDSFSGFGGMIIGRQLELVADERIVQAWRAKNWPDGVFSIVRFDLSPSGAGTLINFTHQAFPDGEKEHLAAGWHKMYWDPLRAYLA